MVMSTSVNEVTPVEREDHSTLKYCVPMWDPVAIRSTLTFNCSQYEPFSKVKDARFKLDVEYYQKGKLVGGHKGSEITSNDILEFDFSAGLKGEQVPTLVMAYLYRPIDQGGIDPYVNHLHKETGVLVTHPMILFMGDDKLGTYLSAAFENSIFWAGIAVEEELESCVVVANPYDTSMGYQISIFGEGKSLHTSPVKRLPPLTFEVVRLEAVYPPIAELKGTNRGLDFSFCVSSQYSSKALFGVKHRTKGYFTTLDHMHEYIFR